MRTLLKYMMMASLFSQTTTPFAGRWGRVYQDRNGSRKVIGGPARNRLTKKQARARAKEKAAKQARRTQRAAA